MQQLSLAVTAAQPASPQRRPRSGPPAPTPAPAPVPVKRLWLCVRFPRLAVEARRPDAAVPAAAVETSKNRAIIAACNEAAEHRGIARGLSLSAARSLCTELIALPRCVETENRLMRRAARRLLNYSSQVALYDAGCLAVELRGSLRLFGGLSVLLERIDNEREQLNVTSCIGVAPTVRAADWFAQYRPGTVIEQAADLKPALRSLPAVVLCGDEKQYRRLRRCGIRGLGDVLRLPRADAARRFGRTFYKPLDEALGGRAEALDCFRPPPVFEAAESFIRPVDNAHWLGEAAAGLLEKLQRFLMRRQRAVQQFECSLHHERGAPTRLRIGTARPVTGAGHLLSLLNEHLERTSLSAPVTHLVIKAAELLEPAAADEDLFESRAACRRDWDELIDRIVTRLGPGTVHRLTARADHRPEYAHHPQTVAADALPATTGPRPLWLLNRCVKLTGGEGQLKWRQQPLQLLPGVERIEQGWWSGDDIRRDYRVAQTPDRARLWVFRDLRSRAWYVQGVFG